MIGVGGNKGRKLVARGRICVLARPVKRASVAGEFVLAVAKLEKFKSEETRQFGQQKWAAEKATRNPRPSEANRGAEQEASSAAQASERRIGRNAVVGASGRTNKQEQEGLCSRKQRCTFRASFEFVVRASEHAAGEQSGANCKRIR